MTAAAQPRRLPVRLGATLVVLFVGAAAVGAYLDWLWWHPTRGIVVTVAAVGLLLLAGVLALARRPLANRVALAAAAIGAGLLIGQAVGPSREALIQSTGTMTVRLEQPVAAEATGPATCQTVASGAQLQVSGDVNTRLPLDGVDARDHPFVLGDISRGDMWAPDSGRRPDEIVVSLYLNSARVVDDGPTEARLRSDPASELQTRFDGNSGRIAFSGLVATEGDAAGILGADGPVAGTIEWTCPD